MKRPAFWDAPGVTWQSFLLSPASLIYGIGRLLHVSLLKAGRTSVPLICVGNVTAGGAGKTPVVLDLGARLLKTGRAVHFLSRGYGGRTFGPKLIAPDRHTAVEVGDEPLLLARTAPTWVAADRLSGARIAAREGAQVVIMDDGFQSPRLIKDLSFLIFDGDSGIGNGALLPAGPMREPLGIALRRAQAAVIIGDDRHNLARYIPKRITVFQADMVPIRPMSDTPGRVVAFAGIGRPEKFFQTLAKAGYDLADTVAFPDHNLFADSELADLRARAKHHGAQLITTEKDFVRLTPMERKGIAVMRILLRWRDETALDQFLADQLNFGD